MNTGELKKNIGRRKLLCLLVIFILNLTVALPSFAAAQPCTISLSQTQIDYGRVSPADVSRQRHTHDGFSLGKQMIVLNVVCAEPTRFGIVFRGTVENKGFATENGQGTFSLVLTQAQADGQAVSWNRTDDIGRNNQRILLAPDVEARPLLAGQSVPISRLTVLVEIETKFPAAQARVVSDLTFSGRGQFQIVPL
ncbi:DUF1120 domain-containing protein [Collimonas humicola]|uniref:hypothetical protein n=1 Tax=Collimonas humicola TaxID=2825886 RepID=UPI001B8D4ACF|nr:hypothetical protein [Collimonas humicola]